MRRNRIDHHTIRTLLLTMGFIIALGVLAIVQALIHLAPILLIIGLPIAYLTGRYRHNQECKGAVHRLYSNAPDEYTGLTARAARLRAAEDNTEPGETTSEPGSGIPDTMLTREQMLKDPLSGARPLYPREHGWREE